MGRTASPSPNQYKSPNLTLILEFHGLAHKLQNLPRPLQRFLAQTCVRIHRHGTIYCQEQGQVVDGVAVGGALEVSELVAIRCSMPK